MYKKRVRRVITMKKLLLTLFILMLGGPALADNGGAERREVYGLYDVYWQTNKAATSKAYKEMEADEAQLERATEIVNEWFYEMKKLEHKKLGYIIEIDRLMAMSNKTRDYDGIKVYVEKIKMIEDDGERITSHYEEMLKNEVDLEKIQSIE